MEKLYSCDNVIFREKAAAEEYARYTYDTHNSIFNQIREWYIDDAERKMTPLEKKKHKMEQRLKKLQEDF